MCIIIHYPKGSKPILTELKQSFESNPHGVGYMFALKGQIVVKKFLRYDEFIASFMKDYSTKLSFVVHFRIGTSGVFDTTNVHPFMVHDDLWFCHNGILDITVPKDSLINDTQIFNNEVLKNLPKDFLKNEYIVKTITGFLKGGYSSNKLVFMDSKGKVTIVNKHFGHTVNGVWYSNDSYIPFINGWLTKPIKTKQVPVLPSIHDRYVCEECGELIHLEDIVGGEGYCYNCGEYTIFDQF